ncbi:hypothetical protein LguiA_018834 [Lonicera macranthoides]
MGYKIKNNIQMRNRLFHISQEAKFIKAGIMRRNQLNGTFRSKTIIGTPFSTVMARFNTIT